MYERFATLAARAATFAGKPLAFLLATATMLAWGLAGPIFHYSDTWQLVVNSVTSVVTFLMVFVIQSSQNRDSAAIQAKLDELIRTMQDARNEFIGIEEHATDAELQAVRDALKTDMQAADPEISKVDRLLGRR